MNLTPAVSKHNVHSFLWHAGFLAFARNFIDVDTVIPAMLVDAGGKSIQIGIMTAIMLGGASLTQLIFAPFISNYSFKKRFLIMGINSRIFSLLVLGLILYYSNQLHGTYLIWFVFILITIFSLGGAFTNISYTDILGKSISQESRKPYFSVRQVVTGVILFISALLAKKLLTLADYPINYAYMFIIGGVSLFIASLGFWKINEVIPSKLNVKSPKHFLYQIRLELRKNSKLIYFLGFINTQGISIALLPFIILYAKENFQAESASTGMFLLFKVVGSVTIGLLLFILAGRFKYRYLLYANVALAITLPLVILFSPTAPPFNLIFFAGG